MDLGLYGSVAIGLVALIVMVVGGVILQLLGLLTAFVFFAIAVMLLYALHKMDALDVDKQPWLVLLPLGALGLGLGLDKTGVLAVQPMSLSVLSVNPLAMPLELMLLFTVIALLIVDIALGVVVKSQ